MTAQVELDPVSFRRLFQALKAEADGKELRRDLVRNLRAAAQPALVAVRSAVMVGGASTPRRASEADARPFRATVARNTTIRVRTSGRRIGVSIRAKRVAIRGIDDVAWTLNNKASWRHPLFGNREHWYATTGRKGWFDGTLKAFRPQFVAAAGEALDAVAERISARTRG